ncbi:MAG: hypothetical protein JWM04_649 [Verrucomicrobiales bacterium]|nr:hypothetical protein [Verrucomicrobiales bacterium]
MIKLSAHHQIELAEPYQAIIGSPRERDYVLHTIILKEANDHPLIQGELVVAGKQTRKAFPLAEKYPVHFVKTYFPGSFHADPKNEFECTQLASEILGSPPPIGYTRNTFRNCFVPGKTLDKLSPFTEVEPPDQNITLAEKAPLPTLIGLWKMLEEIHSQLQLLHGHGLLHGDMQMGNVIISPSPIRPYLIDFEGARIRGEESEEEWKKKCENDYLELLRESIYLQCGLGQQRGALANHALNQLPRLFKDPEPFTSCIKGVGVTEA